MPVTRSAFNRDRVGCRRCNDQDCLHEPFGGASSQRRCTIQDNINLQHTWRWATYRSSPLYYNQVLEFQPLEKGRVVVYKSIKRRTVLRGASISTRKQRSDGLCSGAKVSPVWL